VHDLRLNPDKVLLGGGLVLLSAVLYAIYLVGGGQMVKRLGGIRFAAYASIVSTIAIGLHFVCASIGRADHPERSRLLTFRLDGYRVDGAACHHAGGRHAADRIV